MSRILGIIAAGLWLADTLSTYDTLIDPPVNMPSHHDLMVGVLFTIVAFVIVIIALARNAKP